jgi:stress response protein YsnF/sporulation protein YlmC with PRC-barrel domain
MPTMEDIRSWRGSKVIDPSGEKVGTLEDVYLDRQTGEPQWAAIKTGLFGSKVNFAPLAGVSHSDDELLVPHTKDMIKDAPGVEADGELSPAEERQLFEYYGRADYDSWDGETDATEPGLGRDQRFPAEPGMHAPSADEARGEGAMTRSEEELRVGVRQREIGRARLRKYVVSEPVEDTVTVEREQARLEREPIAGNAPAGIEGPELSEEEHEVVLTEEEPVVEKRIVPKERVRLDKEVVADQETVRDEVRKEVVEPEVPDDLERRRDAY